MIFRFTLIILLLSIDSCCHAQNQPTGYDVQINLNEILLGSSDYIRTFSSGYEGVKGTPNIFEDFHKGNLYFNNKTSISNIMINYDCYHDNVLYSNGSKILIINSQNIDFFTIRSIDEEKFLLFKQVFLESEKRRIFLQVIYDKQSILYKRYKKEFLKADYTGPYNANRRYDEYIDEQEYYIKLSEGEIQQIKSRQKFIKEIFWNNSAMVEKFIKDEDINLKEEDDLIRLINFYDNLE